MTAVLATGTVAQTKRKVLVVMSSATELNLREGKKYQTGFYLNEFVVPLRKLIEAGYEPVIANPHGDRPVMDANSNNAMFFGGDEAARAEALKFAEEYEKLKKPKTLASVVDEGTDGYAGLFIPGGHAPMADLIIDKTSEKSWLASTPPAAPRASSVTGRWCCCRRSLMQTDSYNRLLPMTAKPVPSPRAGLRGIPDDRVFDRRRAGP